MAPYGQFPEFFDDYLNALLKGFHGWFTTLNKSQNWRTEFELLKLDVLLKYVRLRLKYDKTKDDL